jgi:predicted aldo/keto reductase-like oxidoreductase
VYGLKEAAKNAWKGYLQNPGITSKDCADCGYCEKKCPQHLKIRELLKKAEDTLQRL